MTGASTTRDRNLRTDLCCGTPDTGGASGDLWTNRTPDQAAALSDDKQVPWHRVVNARGGVSRRSKGGYEEYQRILLESEGIIFDESGCIDLSTYLWRDQA